MEIMRKASRSLEFWQQISKICIKTTYFMYMTSMAYDGLGQFMAPMHIFYIHMRGARYWLLSSK